MQIRFLKNQKGMSKVQVIVLITLVILLIGLNIFVFKYLSNKKWDQVVISEVNQIRSALELVFASETEFPLIINGPVVLNDRDGATEKICQDGFATLSKKCEKDILAPIPNQFRFKGNQYWYNEASNGNDYLLQFKLITNQRTLGLLKGLNCASRAGIQTGSCFEVN